jgi:hypothetical protein
MSQQTGGPTEVHSWIGQIFAEFRELELQLLIGEIEASLRGGGKKQIRQIGQSTVSRVVEISNWDASYN